MADETPATPDLPPVPNALRMPRSAGGSVERRIEMDATSAALLGVPRAWAREDGSSYFVTGDGVDTLYWPADSAYPGQPKYRWEDQGEGISFGFLIPEADLAKPPANNALLRLRELQSKREAALRAGMANA